MPMREGLWCQWIRTTEELDDLASQWHAVWTQDLHATPFQSPAWLVPWWRCFGELLRSVGIFRRDRLIGLLPFYVYREPQTHERQMLLLGVGTTDYLDGVFAPECTPVDVEDALEFLCADDGWDTLYTSQLRAGSKLLQAMERSERWATRRIAGESCSRIAAVPLRELPQKIRRNAMYYRNRALRTGNLELKVADASNWSVAFDTLVLMHGERWRDRGEQGVFADERMVRWHRQALPLIQRAGLLRLCSLTLNGAIIGVLYSLIDPPGRPERTQYFYLPAYSIRHADLRPGTLLTALAVEQATREGVQTIDMLRGDEDYKQIWHAERVPTFAIMRNKHGAHSRIITSREVAA